MQADEAEQGTPAQQIFFQSLHHMISNARGSTGCIDWLPEGNGFVITKKETFVEDVLSVYFPKAKFSSFARRLKRWGFRRLPTISGAYEHSVFRRDMTFDDYDLDDCAFSPKFRNDSFRPPSTLSDAEVMAALMREINRSKRHAMAPTSSGGKIEAAQALASLGSSEVHHENPRKELQMVTTRSLEAGALSRARSYSPQQLTMDMVQRHHEQFPWRCEDVISPPHKQIQDFQRRMAPAYGIDGRESFQPPPPLQRQLMIPDTGTTVPDANDGVSCVSTSVNEQPDLSILLRMRRDLDNSRRELMKRPVDDSFSQLFGDSSGRVPLPDGLEVRSPYNRAA